MVEKTTELSELISAGIAQRDPKFDALASGGGKTVNMPFWDDLTGDSEVLSDSGALTVNAITADQDAAAINNRGKAWGANQLAKWISGDDPAARIAELAAGFWARDNQRILFKILSGLFDGTNGVLRTTHRLNIYSDVAAGAITDAMRLTGSTFIDGLQKLGDAKQEIVAVAMHSDVEAFLLQRDLIDFIPDSEGKSQIRMFQGRRVIVDDNCPKTAGSNSNAYHTYLFGKGAFAWGEGMLDPKEAVETDRQVLEGNDVLVTRRRFILHPRGVEWTGTASGASPTNTEFATGTNWTKAYLDKNIRILAIRHNVTS
ncbi:MAG TPA: major capsid protein [Prosthecobacter sp.]|nr:major capsid protein [Prosthecobacter sp.]